MEQLSGWFDSERLLGSVTEGITAPLLAALQPSSRMFWVFWLSAGVLVVFALLMRQRGQQTPWNSQRFVRRLTASLFSRRYWLNRSTFIDLSYLLGNSLLRAIVLVPLLGSHLLFTLWVARALQAGFGDAPVLDLHWLAIAASYTLCFFVLEDLSRFSLHLTMHRVPWLWRLHRVHHSAQLLTPLTLHRVHPVEMSLYYARGLLVFGLVSGVFVYLFGRRLSGLDILGVDLLGFAFNLLGANLRHSHFWLSFGPLERWLISPAQHQIHHSRAAEHRDRNFGTCLAIWDRLLGTHIPAGWTRKKLRFGVG